MCDPLQGVSPPPLPELFVRAGRRGYSKTHPYLHILLLMPPRALPSLQGRWPSEVTHGWDKAVSTMHKGEIATLVCGPQYAFGAKGAPPKIPPNATVETELELVDWLDLAVKYNAVPGKIETEEELRTRWGQELADGTSPMRKEAGRSGFHAGRGA